MKNKVIDKLTKEQEAKLPLYREEFLKIGLDTTPCDHAKAEAAVTKSYEWLKLPPPQFVWADSPSAGARIAAQLANGTETPTKEMVRDQSSKASCGSLEAYWVSTYAFVAKELPVEKDGLIDIIIDIIKNCGVYWTFEDIVVMTEKPTKICMVPVKTKNNSGRVVEEMKLHCTTGKALEYKDGTGQYAINGVRYPSLMEALLPKAFEGAGEQKESA